MNLGKGRGQKI